MSQEAAKKRAEPYTRIVERAARDAARHRGTGEEGRRRKSPDVRLGQQPQRRECPWQSMLYGMRCRLRRR